MKAPNQAPAIEELPEIDPDATPIEIPGAIRASMNAPAFAALCDDLVFSLDSLKHRAAANLAAEGRALGITFRMWIGGQMPTDDERRDTLSHLLEFNRRALHMVAGNR
jgi:hypothetical protein